MMDMMDFVSSIRIGKVTLVHSQSVLLQITIHAPVPGTGGAEFTGALAAEGDESFASGVTGQWARTRHLPTIRRGGWR